MNPHLAMRGRAILYEQTHRAASNVGKIYRNVRYVLNGERFEGQSLISSARFTPEAMKILEKNNNYQEKH